MYDRRPPAGGVRSFFLMGASRPHSCDSGPAKKRTPSAGESREKGTEKNREEGAKLIGKSKLKKPESTYEQIASRGGHLKGGPNHTRSIAGLAAQEKSNKRRNSQPTKQFR